MKIITLIKIFSGIVVGAGGITTAVIFSDVNTIKLPLARVMTNNNYQKMLIDQNKVNDKNININYGLLQTSQYSILDLLSGSTKINNGNYIFSFGSESYKQTSKMLKGLDDFSISENFPPLFNTSLMLQIYDLFFNEINNPSSEYNFASVPAFYSYVDVCDTKEIKEQSFLLNERYLSGNNKEKNKITWGEGLDEKEVETIQGVTTNPLFNYKPEFATYNYLSNANEAQVADKEPVYTNTKYRNDKAVFEFNRVSDFISSYSSSLGYSGSFSSKGSVLLVKNTEKEGFLAEWLSDDTFENATASKTKIIDFYKVKDENTNESTKKQSKYMSLQNNKKRELVWNYLNTEKNKIVLLNNRNK